MTDLMNPKQTRFVQEYLIDLNATQAAIRAGYSKKTAQMQSSRLLSKGMIQAAVAEGQATIAEKLEITVESVARELALLGFADMGTYIALGAGETTVRLDWSDLPEGATRCIQEITQEEHTGGKGHETGEIRRTKFKLYDKKGSLELLGRHLGMFNDKLALGVDSDLAALMERIDGKSRGV